MLRSACLMTLVASAASTPAAAGACSMTGAPWMVPFGRGSFKAHYVFADGLPAGYTIGITGKQGSGPQNGTLKGNAVTLEAYTTCTGSAKTGNYTCKPTPGAVQCVGTISADCNNITWTSGHRQPPAPRPCKKKPCPPPKPMPTDCFGTSWCRAWTPGCKSSPVSCARRSCCCLCCCSCCRSCCSCR